MRPVGHRIDPRRVVKAARAHGPLHGGFAFSVQNGVVWFQATTGPHSPLWPGQPGKEGGSLTHFCGFNSKHMLRLST